MSAGELAGRVRAARAQPLSGRIDDGFRAPGRGAAGADAAAHAAGRSRSHGRRHVAVAGRAGMDVGRTRPRRRSTASSCSRSAHRSTSGTRWCARRRTPAASAEDRGAAHLALATATNVERDPERRVWHRRGAATDPTRRSRPSWSARPTRAQRTPGRRGIAATFLEGRRADRRAGRARAPPARRGAGQARRRRVAGGAAIADRGRGRIAVGSAEAAEVERLRGQIAFDQRRLGDAARLLVSAAKRLEPLDAERARATHLEALGAAIWAGGSGASRRPARGRPEGPLARRRPRP